MGIKHIRTCRKQIKMEVRKCKVKSFTPDLSSGNLSFDTNTPPCEITQLKSFTGYLHTPSTHQALLSFRFFISKVKSLAWIISTVPFCAVFLGCSQWFTSSNDCSEVSLCQTLGWALRRYIRHDLPPPGRGSWCSRCLLNSWRFDSSTRVAGTWARSLWHCNWPHLTHNY